jgi:hypothetical protein
MMNTRKIAQATRHHLATCSAVGTLLLSSALLVACGGGGGVSTGGTGAAPTATGLSVGPVNGIGSIIVNGVEFEHAQAEIHGEDDSTQAEDNSHKLGSDDVKLGMEVEVEHGVVTCPTAGLTVATCDVTPVATATKVSFGNNSLVAPITDFVLGAVVPGTGATLDTFKLLGQPVQRTATTTVNLEVPPIALANGVVVEVHGSFDKATGITTASRIEVKAATAGAFTGALRLRGVLDLTVTPSTIGGTKVTMTDAQKVGLTSGQVVRAKLSGAAEPYTVVSIKSAQRKLDDQKGKEAEVEGVIDTVGTKVGDILPFTINGAAVSVDTTKISPASLAAIIVGSRVEAEGKVDASGTLVATTVTAHNEAKDALVEKEFLGYTLKPTDASGSTFVNTYDKTAHTFEVWTTVAPFKLVQKVVIVQAGQTNPTVFKGKGATVSEDNIAAQTGTSFNLLDIHGVIGADGNLRATIIQILPKKGV